MRRRMVSRDSFDRLRHYSLWYQELKTGEPREDPFSELELEQPIGWPPPVPSFVLLGDEAIDGIEGVENEMRIHLAPQGF